MQTAILVTGGTGTIGSRVVPLLERSGRAVRTLSRHPVPDVGGGAHYQGDTVRDIGLREAFDGAEAVLHLAGGARGDDIAARNVVAAAQRSAVHHLVLISVIGADRMPIGYFRAKATTERLIAESGIAWTVLRVAQLHDFVLPLVKLLVRMPLTPVPGGVRLEPVDVDEVAARLAHLTLGSPKGRVADLAGPEVLSIAQLSHAYADASGQRVRRHLPLRVPGGAGRAYRAGENLAATDAQRATRTWRQYVTSAADEL